MMKTIKKLSFENSKRLLDRGLKIHDMMTEMIMRGVRESEDELRKEVNKHLYELAEKRGISLWDLCFHVVPKTNVRLDQESTNYSVVYDITLEPLEFEFEKGPGYWKGKYFALKEKMRSLIDSKDDDPGV